MEDVSQLQSKVSALESENKSLKEVIEQLDAQCKALDQTIIEVLKANINIKTGCSLLEGRYAKLTAEFEGLRGINKSEAVLDIIPE